MFSQFRKECAKIIGVSENALETPPKGMTTDLAFPCFNLAKEQRKNPMEIAKELENKLKGKRLKFIKEIKASGPYLNFFIDYEKFSPLVAGDVLKQKDKYGSGSKKETIVIEFPGPNTNKPLHLGHLRNMTLGISLSNILKFSGYDVKNVDIINDRGVHICKSMMAYKEFGNGSEPDKKPDHFVGDFYVLFAKKLESLEDTQQKIRQMLVDWENGDKETRALWKKMNNWAVSGFKQTYERFGVNVDKAYYESEHYLEGKKIVTDGLKKHIFTKDAEGNIIVDLEERGLGKRVLLRGDGTTLYITQDIVLALKRYNDFHMDRMVYVVGEEQRDHFKALFSVFEILGYKFAKKCYHLSYGMVNLPEGRMKSREGTAVDADNLMDELRNIAMDKIKERGGDDEKKAEKIGLSAIKYFIVKFDPDKTITYDPKASLEFEGDTGPYIQYTYARANSIMQKSTAKISTKPLFTERIELDIIRKISQFSDMVEKSAGEYRPNILAAYVFELATLFNEFYHSLKVVGEPQESNRLALVAAVMQVIENGTRLLGIDVLKEM